jgi:hypothetical protein
MVGWLAVGSVGREPDLVGDAGGPAALGVGQPPAGQVQLAVDHPVAGRGGMGQVDGDLSVVDLAGGAGVLTAHPDRVGAPLEIAGLVDHQHRGGSARCSPSQARTSSRTACSSQTAPASRCCRPSGVVSPACSAIVQQCFLGRSASSPPTNARACRRGPHPGKPAGDRPSSSSSPACQLAGVRLGCRPAQPVPEPPLTNKITNSGWSTKRSRRPSSRARSSST